MHVHIMSTCDLVSGCGILSRDGETETGTHTEDRRGKIHHTPEGGSVRPMVAQDITRRKRSWHAALKLLEVYIKPKLSVKLYRSSCIAALPQYVLTCMCLIRIAWLGVQHMQSVTWGD